MPFRKRRSLAVKIPLLMSALLLAALAAMSVASYVELRRALVDVATERLRGAATQMANVFGVSARQRIAAILQLKQRPEIAAYLKSRDATQEAPMRQAITTYLGAAIELADVELWDTSGKRVFVAGSAFSELTEGALAEHMAQLNSPSAVVGALRLEADTLLFPVGGRVVDGDEFLGYIVERRRISNALQTQQTVTLLSGLIGNAASIVIGNQDGSAWTNLSKAVTGIPITAAGGERLWDYERAGMRRSYALAAPIPLTPWIIAIEMQIGRAHV